MRARGRSIIYAFRGLGYAIRTQHNLWIDIVFLILVFGLSFWLGLNAFEWAIIVVVVGFVLAMEVMNTAVETLVDLLSPEWNDRAGRVKDLAAGAVLLSVITSVVIGFLVLGPPLLDKLRDIF